MPVFVRYWSDSGHWSAALEWLKSKPIGLTVFPGDGAMKIDGACHCGLIAYEAEADPEMTGICHCTDSSLYRARHFVASCPRGKVLLSFDQVNRKYTSKQLKAAPNGNRRFVQIVGRQSILQRSMTGQRFIAFV